MTSIIFIGGGPASVTYVGDATGGATNSTAHSIASVPIGAAADDRLVVIAVHSLSVASAPLVNATIGGITATLGTYISAATAVGIYGTQFIYVLVPTGTTATVALTFAASVFVRLRVWRVVGQVSASPTHHNEASASVTPLSTTINVESNGVLIAACSGRDNGGTMTISAGVTQDYAASDWSADGRVAGGSLDVTATEAGRTVTITSSGIGGTSGFAVAAIAFR